MKLVVLVLLLFSFVHSEVEEEIQDLNTLWDKNLLKLRWQIFKDEEETMEKIDEIFYDVCKQIIDRYIEPFDKMRVEWVNECRSFEVNNIKETIAYNTMRKLINFCDTIEYFLQRVPKFAKDYLSQIYNGGILSENLLEVNSKSFYSYAVERFEFLLPMYHYNSSCVVKTFSKLDEIYKNYTRNIDFIHQQYKFLMPKSEFEYEGNLLEIVRLVRKAQKDFSICKKAFNQTNCFEPILDIECIIPKQCSVYYHLLQSISDFFKLFDRNKSIHSILLNARYDKVLELSSNFGDILINWENQVEKCLVDE